MQFEAYRDLIQSLEVEAAHDPRGYTLRVGAFGMLGYAYVVGVFAALAALLIYIQRFTHGRGALLAIKGGLLLLPVAIVLLRVVLVRVPTPRGVPLTRERVPALFSMIDEVAAALHAPPPHRVLLTADYNCSVLQRPRLGIFGWPENVLMLGLPMLEALSRTRLRAVLAHELGHLAAQHSTFAGRMHMISDVWEQILHRLSANRGLLFQAFEPFFRWYGPRFQAMGFVLGRRQEYFADGCSRRVAGARATRGTLVRMEVMARHYHEVLEQTIHTRVREQSSPTEDVVPIISQRMREDPAAEQAQSWIDESLRAETGYEHTHPALRDRLRAIESNPAPVLADALAEPGATAAQDLLGSALDSLTREVSAAWVSDMTQVWRGRHQRLAEAARTAKGPVEAGEAVSQEPDAEWKTLAARIDLDGERGAGEKLAAFLEAHPDHAIAHFRMGQTLLNRGEAAGLQHLDRAMELDSDAIPVGCRVAIEYLRAQGRSREAEDFTRRAWEFSELAEKAELERRVLRRKDRLGPHGLPTAVVAQLRRRISSESWIAEAYLARKEVTLRTEKPCYVLGLTLNRTWYKLADPNKERQRVLTLLRDGVIPAGTWLFMLEGDLRWARKRIARIDRSLIWSRPRRGAASSSETAKAA